MIVSYDALKRIETPELTLCNPGSARNESGSLSKVVGVIPNHSDEEFVFNFNSPSELNFRAHLVPASEGESDTVTHSVVIGDTPASVANMYGISQDDLINANSGVINKNMTVPAGYPIITSHPVNCTTTKTGTITFSVSATGSGLSYQWQYYNPSAGQWENSTAAGNKTSTLSFTQTGNTNRNALRYRCVVSNACGTAISKEALCIITDVRPAIVIQPESCAKKEGETLSFTVVACGSNMSYQWQYYSTNNDTWTNASSAGSTSATFTPDAVVEYNGMRLRCVITNSIGSVTSKEVIRGTNANLPVISTNPSNASAAYGNTATFSVTTSGTVTKYQWQCSTDEGRSWYDISGQNAQTASIPAVQAYNNALIRCTASNSYGTVKSGYARLTISSYPRMDVGLSLSIPNQNVSTYTKKVFGAIQDRRLIYVNDIGYFVITGVTDGYDGAHRYKDVSAQSVDAEIQAHTVPYIPDGTYRFHTEIEQGAINPDAEDIGILDKLMPSLPIWTIGHVQESIASKFRSFSDVDATENILSFMLDELQNAYECVFIFDIDNREINVYDQSTFASSTDVLISKDDFIESMDESETTEDLYTAISVVGDGDVTISSVNPLGTSVIYRFDHYIDWMTPALGAKVIQWESDINNEKDHYISLNKQYYNALTAASNLQYEIDMLNTQRNLYKRCRDNIVAYNDMGYVESYNSAIAESGGTEITATDINTAKADIDAKIAEIDTQIRTKGTEYKEANNMASGFLAQINGIQTMVSFDSYFGEIERNELYNYIFEGQYRDEYVIITDDMTFDEQFEQMNTLYNRAKKTLEKISEPTQEFSVDVTSIIFEKDFRHISEQLRTGALVNVELLDGDIAQLFLSTMSVNYQDHNFSITFGNRYNKFDPRSLFEKTLGSVSKSANTVSNIKDVIMPIKEGEINVMREALQNSRDITMAGALAADDQEVVIDQSGYTGKRKVGDNYSDNQIKITNESIVFTEDGWNTAVTAVGKVLWEDGNGQQHEMYGINGKYLLGDVIVGNNLILKDANGRDVLTALEDGITTEVSNRKTAIDELTGVGGPIAELQSEISQVPEQISLTISETVYNTDGQINGGDAGFTTSAGYTFDNSGLTITGTKDSDGMQNLVSAKGMYVTRISDSKQMLVADSSGVKAVNLTADNFLIFGEHGRFEKFTRGSDTERVACFFV